MIERSRAVRESDAVFDLDEGHSAETPRLTRVKHPHLNVPGFDEVLHAARVKAVLQDLLGPTVRLQTTKLNTKAPGGGAAVEWHQDWAFYPHTNDDLLAIGLILADVDEANGPLMVIPGSHKGPTLDHTRNGVFAGAIDPSDPAVRPVQGRDAHRPGGLDEHPSCPPAARLGAQHVRPGATDLLLRVGRRRRLAAWPAARPRWPG